MMITEAERGWMAGLMDGEGCIGLYPRLDHGKRSGWDYYVGVSNSNPQLIQTASRIITDITGKMPYVHLDKTRGNRRPVYNLVVYSKKAITIFLEAIRPHLTAKAEQADVLLMAIKARGHGSRGSNPEVLNAASQKLRLIKASYGDAEVTLAGLRSPTHRNDYQVSPNNNPGTSAQHEAKRAS